MSLLKNSMWNIVGYAIPSLVAIPALGYLARKLGTEQFGLFTLSLAIVGYASVFDVGITRAVIREVSIYRDNTSEKLNIVSTSTICILILGFIGGGVMFLLSPLMPNLLNVSPIYINYVENGTSLLAICIPIFLVNQLWMAVLEGEEKFKIVNIQKTIANIFLAVLPVILVLSNNNLEYAIIGLVLGRLLSVLLSGYFCWSVIIRAGLNFDKHVFYRLIRFGSWITISNIISPVMTLFDRFILSHIMGAASVAFYTAPAEGVAKLSIIPAAISRAIFPKLSNANSSAEKKHHQRLGLLLLMVTCIPVVLFIFIFSKNILVIWMGSSFDNELPVMILRILAVGFLFNALAQIPYANIQAIGKAKITAMIHCVEIIPYLLILYYFIDHFGLIGVAIAWFIRTLFDFLILSSMNKYITK